MSKIDLVSRLVRQLCEVDDHESDLAEDALYDFVSNPNTSLSEKQDALAFIERKIKHIAENIGFFDEEDITVRISDKDKFALYSLLVARRYLMDQMMGEPSKDYVERVSYQSGKLAILMAECLKQGTEMWDAVQNSSSFKANDYLQYGEYVLEYKADSCQAVLALEDDDAYGSAFPFIHRLVYTIGEQTDLFDNNLMRKKLILDALADKDWEEEDLPSEVASWDESILFSQAFERIKLCPAMLALHCSLPYSIPDIVRMNNFVINTSITCEKNFSEDTFCKHSKK
ncbi:MAG: hypothetical protein MR470_08165 [Prevotella sp.]|nr:hypothetical protein [Prevotella sp.]